MGLVVSFQGEGSTLKSVIFMSSKAWLFCSPFSFAHVLLGRTVSLVNTVLLERVNP